MGHIIIWTAEDKVELKRLFQTRFEGVFLSHSVIARMMDKTRNAVIGKIHRMEMTRDQNVPCKGLDNRIVDPVQQKRVVTVPRVPATYGRSGRTKPVPAHGGASMAGECAGAASPHAVQILEVTDKTCRFPIGHVGHEGFHLCGDQVGNRKPYCEYHAKICYTPLKERRDNVPSYFARYRPT